MGDTSIRTESKAIALLILERCLESTQHITASIQKVGGEFLVETTQNVDTVHEAEKVA